MIVQCKTMSTVFYFYNWNGFALSNQLLKEKYQGPVVQSVVSLISSLVVKMLTVLVSKISNSQVFLLKHVSSFCNYSHFFSKNISVYAIFNDKNFNDMLTNDIVSFKQLGPDEIHGKIKALTEWVGRLSPSVGWENGSERRFCLTLKEI